jgi:mono/diheme cytochrome c family protein
MIVNLFILVVMVILAIVLGWLASRALKIRPALIKWPAAFLSGLLSLAVLALTIVALVGYARLNIPPYRYALRDLAVDASQARVQRGERLAHICVDCHSSTGQLPLDGGNENLLAGGPPLGEVYAPNLTPAGPLKDWTDAEIIRAMREGIDNRGRPLVVMPSMALHNASDADISDILAYLRSQPAVTHELPQRNLSVIAALFVGAGLFPTSAQVPILEPINAPEVGSMEYGAYLVASLGCADCHGKDMTGLSGGLGPSGPNLTAIVPKWKEEEFMIFFREGVDPTGRLVADVMPWKNYSLALSDEELQALFRYLSTLQHAESNPR